MEFFYKLKLKWHEQYATQKYSASFTADCVGSSNFNKKYIAGLFTVSKLCERNKLTRNKYWKKKDKVLKFLKKKLLLHPKKFALIHF